ncbi:MAG: hypothetical protein J6L88_02875 [Clostridia bacterium]|nr:hypothetical protein [Clostridia bacterium]
MQTQNTDCLYKRKVARFDFAKKPRRPGWIMHLAKYAVSWPLLWMHNFELEKEGMEDIENKPYLLLVTHSSILDLPAMLYATHPMPAINVMSLEGFNTYTEPLMRHLGVIGKRKYINDIHLVKNIRCTLHELEAVFALFPEARYSLDGCHSFLPESLGKLVRLMGVPVAVLQLHGNFIHNPHWNKHGKKALIVGRMFKLLTKEETKSLPVDQINARIREAFTYDDFAWQRDNRIRIDHKKRADGLHCLLYKCPACGKEHEMDSEGVHLWCRSCGKKWFMTEFGQLEDVNGGDAIYPHIPDWTAWERACVREEVRGGTYRFEDNDVRIETLPNAWRFFKHGKGRVVQTSEGTTVECLDAKGELFTFTRDALNLDSMHIEYDYLGRGDCIDISVSDNSFWCYLSKRDAITKIAFATEEIFKFAQEKNNG